MGIRISQLALTLSRLAAHAGLNRRQVYGSIMRSCAPSLDTSLRQLQQHSLFLIVSTGRTGTRWLAHLLNQADGAYVVHEPVPHEQHLHARAICHPETAITYLRTFRLREMAVRVREHNPDIYGEVNSALRFYLPALKQLLPSLRIIHLVRDGRDVVRSIYNRRLKSKKNPLYDKIVPPALDAYASRWHTLSAFEKVCWGWQAENQFMRENTAWCAKFEDITRSYELLSSQVLAPLGLSLKKELWERSVQTPLNATQQYSFGAWKTWTQEQQDIFLRMCSTEMLAYGYCLPAIIDHSCAEQASDRKRDTA